MKQYRITSEDISKDSSDDAYLSPDDPIQEIKRLQYLGGLGAQQRLQEYRASQQPAQNITHTAAENVRIMKQNNIQPGTPEWFQLWFSRPYLTGKQKK